MNDLREAIRQVYSDHADRCHDPEVCIDEPIDTDKWRGCSGHTADAVLDVITAHMTVTDEDALQLLRGYWRNVGASFHDAEIKHVVELLEAFVARRKPDPTPELRERGVTLTAEDLADLDDMELHFSNQDTHPRWSRYRRLVTRLFNDDALKGDQK